MGARYVVTGSRRLAQGAIGGALLALLSCMLLAAAGEAKTRIAWSSVDPDGAVQRLVTANPNGNDLRKLTRGQEKKIQDIDAQFSPDGTQVAFERDLDN